MTEPRCVKSFECDDAISRDAVIKDFTQWRGKMAYSIGEDYSGVSVLDKAIRVIKGMPSMPKGQSKCDLPQGDTSEVAVNERRSGRLSHGFTEDAISRILKRMWNCRGKHTTSIDKVAMEQIIRDELPSVTPQQKYGKWIVHEKPHGIRYLECPYCNTWYLNEHLIRNSYCPNCGCRMVEPQERSE